MADPAQRYVPPAPSGTTTSSTTTGAGELQDTAREKTQELSESVRERSSELTTKARTWMNEEADQRSTALGTQARTIAGAMRETSNRLRTEGQEQPARLTEMTAERIEQAATYLTEADGDRLMDDVTDLARRQPWLFAAGGLLLGFAASRFMKAATRDSDRRGSARDAYRYDRSYGPTTTRTDTATTANPGTIGGGPTGTYRPTGTDDV